jgi:hypothetical protein
MARAHIRIDREVSSDNFRVAMRHLVGGASVITAGRGKEITGMTVTSVSSLSVDPPTLIVSINRDSSSWPLIKRFGYVAERFTGKGGLKGAARFAGAQWFTRASGVPLLAGAGGARLRGGRYRRTAFPRHRDRTRARYSGFHAHRGVGVLARPICRYRSE